VCLRIIPASIRPVSPVHDARESLSRVIVGTKVKRRSTRSKAVSRKQCQIHELPCFERHRARFREPEFQRPLGYVASSSCQPEVSNTASMPNSSPAANVTIHSGLSESPRATAAALLTCVEESAGWLEIR
jgi:hypothetical protein